MPGYANPQNLNRYSYVRNNPLRYTDPTGHRACGDGEAVSCETGLSNNPPDHTNIGCGPGLKPCIGNSPNKDKDKDENEVVKELQFCLEHSDYPECSIPEQASISDVQPNYDFIAPWEFDHLDAWGFQLNGTGCFIVICGDVSLSLIGEYLRTETE